MTTATEKLVNSNLLMALGRAAQVIGVPVLLAVSAWTITLLLNVRDEQTRQLGQISTLEVRLTARIVAVEDRQGAQSRRLDLTDSRIERLTEISTKFSIDVAVLAERISALLAANQQPPRIGVPR